MCLTGALLRRSPLRTSSTLLPITSSHNGSSVSNAGVTAQVCGDHQGLDRRRALLRCFFPGWERQVTELLDVGFPSGRAFQIGLLTDTNSRLQETGADQLPFEQRNALGAVGPWLRVGV